MENLSHAMRHAAWLSVNLDLDQETWVETDATAPSTTDGVLLLLGVPGLLEPVALEFRCCACGGIKIEFNEGFKDNSARQQKGIVIYIKYIQTFQYMYIGHWFEAGWTTITLKNYFHKFYNFLNFNFFLPMSSGRIGQCLSPFL